MTAGDPAAVPADDCYCTRTDVDVTRDIPDEVPWPEGATVAVVFGSRSYQQGWTPSRLADRIQVAFREAGVQPDAIVSGGAAGADAAGEAYAVQQELPL